MGSRNSQRDGEGKRERPFGFADDELLPLLSEDEDGDGTNPNMQE